jgi:hypothetical protein
LITVTSYSSGNPISTHFKPVFSHGNLTVELVGNVEESQVPGVSETVYTARDDYDNSEVRVRRYLKFLRSGNIVYHEGGSKEGYPTDNSIWGLVKPAPSFFREKVYGPNAGAKSKPDNWFPLLVPDDTTFQYEGDMTRAGFQDLEGAASAIWVTDTIQAEEEDCEPKTAFRLLVSRTNNRDEGFTFDCKNVPGGNPGESCYRVAQKDSTGAVNTTDVLPSHTFTVNITSFLYRRKQQSDGFLAAPGDTLGQTNDLTEPSLTFIDSQGGSLGVYRWKTKDCLTGSNVTYLMREGGWFHDSSPRLVNNLPVSVPGIIMRDKGGNPVGYVDGTAVGWLSNPKNEDSLFTVVGTVPREGMNINPKDIYFPHRGTAAPYTYRDSSGVLKIAGCAMSDVSIDRENGTYSKVEVPDAGGDFEGISGYVIVWVCFKNKATVRNPEPILDEDNASYLLRENLLLNVKRYMRIQASDSDGSTWGGGFVPTTTIVTGRSSFLFQPASYLETGVRSTFSFGATAGAPGTYKLQGGSISSGGTEMLRSVIGGTGDMVPSLRKYKAGVSARKMFRDMSSMVWGDSYPDEIGCALAHMSIVGSLGPAVKEQLNKVNLQRPLDYIGKDLLGIANRILRIGRHTSTIAVNQRKTDYVLGKGITPSPGFESSVSSHRGLIGLPDPHTKGGANTEAPDDRDNPESVELLTVVTGFTDIHSLNKDTGQDETHCQCLPLNGSRLDQLEVYLGGGNWVPLRNNFTESFSMGEIPPGYTIPGAGGSGSQRPGRQTAEGIFIRNTDFWAKGMVFLPWRNVGGGLPSCGICKGWGALSHIDSGPHCVDVLAGQTGLASCACILGSRCPGVIPRAALPIFYPNVVTYSDWKYNTFESSSIMYPSDSVQDRMGFDLSGKKHRTSVRRTTPCADFLKYDFDNFKIKIESNLRYISPEDFFADFKPEIPIEGNMEVIGYHIGFISGYPVLDLRVSIVGTPADTSRDLKVTGPKGTVASIGPRSGGVMVTTLHGVLTDNADMIRSWPPNDGQVHIAGERWTVQPDMPIQQPGSYHHAVRGLTDGEVPEEGPQASSSNEMSASLEKKDVPDRALEQSIGETITVAREGSSAISEGYWRTTKVVFELAEDPDIGMDACTFWIIPGFSAISGPDAAIVTFISGWRQRRVLSERDLHPDNACKTITASLEKGRGTFMQVYLESANGRRHDLTGHVFT